MSEAPLTIPQIKLVANALRHHIITMLEAAGSGHPGGSLSAADILATLFFGDVLDFDPNNPDDHTKDRFFLSKGHAAPVLYAVFYELGWINKDDLLHLRHLGGRLQGHPDSHSCPGLEICSGSLGQGLSVGVGAALGMRLDAKEAGALPRRVYVLCGDGELQEGSNWEALMFAAHSNLSNLTMILDYNNLQIDGHVSDVCSLGDIPAKLQAFGWDVQDIDGHNIATLKEALFNAQKVTTKPQAIICRTLKGKGVSFMEDAQGWHGVAPSHEEAALALAELDAAREKLLKEAAHE